ncbi:DUF5979 domain-containing protein [Agromyces seonyuensis]|uniref:DUF5979 domain-containing protein n=1 Tax=Agromyces seonyuensis TaxID=2662446 RepID=UPI001365598D|nr:DUF5979 domain-containing protein [Agromyces seonyuensis]
MAATASATTASTGHRRWAAWAALLGLLATLFVVVPISAAIAAPSGMTITKQVDGVDLSEGLEPGQTFTYTVAVNCSDANCIDAEFSDTLPAELAGFGVVSASVDPAGAPLEVTTEGCVGSPGTPTEITEDCTFTVDATSQFGDEQGMANGASGTLVLQLQVPEDLDPTWEFNGDTITNTGVVDWANGPGSGDTPDTYVPATDSDDAQITVVIPIETGIEATKSWDPPNQQFLPGDTSTITIGADNASNVPSDTLVIQEPTGAVDGAAELSADNPFRIVDFAGFGTSALPPNATSVTVDVYVFDGTSWNWEAGEPGTEPALPADVDPAEVGGIRLTYSPDVQGDSTVSVPFTVEQRETDRNTAAFLGTGDTVTNSITATATPTGADPITDDATAPFTIDPLTIAVEAGKAFNPASVPAGVPTTATLTATNTSNGPVDTMTVSDTGPDPFFGEDMVFGGFPTGIPWPTTTTSATITWEIDGAAQEPVPFSEGENPPPPPAGTVTGFSITYEGSIDENVPLNIPVTVTPQVALVAPGENTPYTNTVDVSAENAVGTDSDSADADLDVWYPDLELLVDKQISPQAPVLPGGTVVASITAAVGTGTAQVAPSEIVVEDSWDQDDPSNFWNAFNATSIAPTQVPANTTLTIEYQTADGTWTTLDVYGPFPGPTVYSLSTADFAAAVAPNSPEDVTGLRFDFENPDGFPAGTSVQPNVDFVARGELRDGSGETAPGPDDPSTYTNIAIGNSHADIPDIPDGIDSDPDDGTADAQIAPDDAGEGPGLDTEKRWVEPGDKSTDLDVLESQSGEQASTRLGWLVARSGAPAITVTDPADAESAPVSETVFQAFDLLSIDAITLADDPLLQWDDVTSVELLIGGAWTEVPAPGGTWMGADGFVGYTLTADETANATGARLVYEPNDANRAASSDPLRPEPGSGIATSAVGQYRPVFLTFELRNVVREETGTTADPWVTADNVYNDPGAGAVWNTVLVEAGTDYRDTDQDNIALQDFPPLVSVEKTASPTSVPVPESADVDPDAYPIVTYSLVAQNEAVPRASYIRVTDPITCPAGAFDECLTAADDWDADPWAGATYDPATNPWERFVMLGLAFDSDPAQVDPDASIVTLWLRAADGSLSSAEYSVTEAAALGEADLADAVGVSVVYQGTSPETEGGSIENGSPITLTITNRVRQYERSNPAVLVGPGTVPNNVQAQGYDPVLTPDGISSTPNDDSAVPVELTGGVLDVATTKTITPESVLEVDAPTTPITVGLAADSADSTVAAQQVVIEDSDPAFWNGVQLADDPALTATIPAGADQVRVDALVGTEWIEGEFGPDPVLPTGATPAGVIGLRFTFDNAAGTVFSNTAPPEPWTAEAGFALELLTTMRDGTELPFPGTLENTVTATSERTDGLYAPATAEGADSLVLDDGTHAIDVVKTQPGTTHTVAIGASLPWTLQFTNTGTGILTVTELTDSLPEYLVWDGLTPTFATSEDGTLSTAPSVSSAGQVITMVWPAEANEMQPGEVYTITINLALQPGLDLTETTTNTFVVATDEPLDACTNDSGNGQGVVAGVDPNECGTTNYVQPNPGGSLFALKRVNGDIDSSLIDGETNVSGTGAACSVDDEGFTYFPCASYTGIGQTDQWKVSITNSGSIPYTGLTIVDPLPAPGDRLLATGSPRNSEFAPVFDEEFGVTYEGPIGATVTREVTTTVGACIGTDPTSSAWLNDTTCDTTAAWEPLSGFAGDPVAITALRTTLDFSTSPGGVLSPGGQIAVRAQSYNEPISDAYPDGAPIDVPFPGTIAWNQLGVTATLTQGSPLSVAPVQAGVTMLAGNLGVEKTISGDGAAIAPTEFDFGTVCTVAGVDLALPDDGALVVSEADGYTATILGIPLGAECTVTETGEIGTYGESSRIGDAQTVDILVPAETEDATPGQIATIENVYDAPPPTPTPPPSPTPPPTVPPTDGGTDAGGGGLAGTGVDGVWTLLAAGLALALLGAVAGFVARRRGSRS